MGNMVDRFEELWDAQERFSERAFGPSSYRGPHGPLEHLKRAAQEAQNNPSYVTELADCLILVIDAARRAGFSRGRLLEAALQKVATNETRDWPD